MAELKTLAFAFEQISDHMVTKMSEIEKKFPADLQPKVDPDFDFMLNSEPLLKEIRKLNCKQIKGTLTGRSWRTSGHVA